MMDLKDKIAEMEKLEDDFPENRLQPVYPKEIRKLAGTLREVLEWISTQRRDFQSEVPLPGLPDDHSRK